MKKKKVISHEEFSGKLAKQIAELLIKNKFNNFVFAFSDNTGAQFKLNGNKFETSGLLKSLTLESDRLVSQRLDRTDTLSNLFKKDK